ncbi:MAG: hypothetical protein LBV72_14690 [Tannerella sp.]|jgi:hypothetical protein|nr:hypothetical protein [Tannerella sp.]
MITRKITKEYGIRRLLKKLLNPIVQEIINEENDHRASVSATIRQVLQEISEDAPLSTSVGKTFVEKEFGQLSKRQFKKEIDKMFSEYPKGTTVRIGKFTGLFITSTEYQDASGRLIKKNRLFPFADKLSKFFMAINRIIGVSPGNFK